MNKIELVKKVATEKGVTQAVAVDWIYTVLNACVDTAMEEGKVVVSPFKFVRKDRAARMGINPKTQERIEIGASSKVVLKIIGS